MNKDNRIHGSIGGRIFHLWINIHVDNDEKNIDAAHCHSPVGGQGMNLGLQDGKYCFHR